MKHFYYALITAFTVIIPGLSIPAYASNVPALADSTGISIDQPDILVGRLAAPSSESEAESAATNSKKVGTSGDTTSPYRDNYKNGYFRIEVYSDNSRNAKAKATAKRQYMQNRFPLYPTKLAFDAPFWRVRVGEFKSRADAESALAEIRKAFPSYGTYIRIVHD